MIIEVCVDSVLSASNAAAGGASRIELCGNLALGGGTTPSLGLLRSVQKAIPGIPIMVMVRPRTGDFLYTEDEFQVMLEDVRIFKQYGVAGVVAGFVTADGDIDVERTKQFALESRPLQFCFHRAFDMCRDHEAGAAFHSLSEIEGVTRVLTSGLGPSAPKCLDTLESLLWMSQSLRATQGMAPTILPGSGINDGSIATILKRLLPLGLTDVHLSGGAWVDNGMKYRKEGMGMGVGGNGDWGVWTTRSDQVKSVKEQADRYEDEAALHLKT